MSEDTLVWDLSRPTELPGLTGVVECGKTGEVFLRQGERREELPMVTNSFLELGEQLAEALDCGGLLSLTIHRPQGAAVFARRGAIHSGAELRWTAR